MELAQVWGSIATAQAPRPKCDLHAGEQGYEGILCLQCVLGPSF